MSSRGQRKERLPGVQEVMGPLRIFPCPTLESCWSIHPSRFNNEIEIHRLYSSIKQ